MGELLLRARLLLTGAGQFVRGMGPVIARIGALVVAVRGLQAAGRTVVRVFRGVIEATTRQEAAESQIAARIRSTGNAAGYGADELRRMASALQDVTTYGDEATLEMQALLLSFTNIRGDNFRDATEGVLDLATGIGTDLPSAAIQLGKALNDPARGLDALSRSGTTFTKSQRETIKQMAEGGRVAEAQRLILRELALQYGGSARAARDTFGGALTALRNAAGDLLEGRGGLNEAKDGIESLTRVLSSPEVRDGAQALVGVMTELVGLAAKLAAVGVPPVLAAIRSFGVGDAAARERRRRQTNDLGVRYERLLQEREASASRTRGSVAWRAGRGRPGGSKASCGISWKVRSARIRAWRRNGSSTSRSRGSEPSAANSKTHAAKRPRARVRRSRA